MSKSEGDVIELPVPVQDAPHWRVILRPETFEAERISTLKECWNLMESCRVLLRGWDYPHVDREDRANGQAWIASWCDWKGHREYWRFYQSGQFIHLCSFWEDSYPEKAKQRAQRIRFMPQDFSPSGYLDIVDMLCTITEIFEFATRLAQKGVFGDSLSITVQMTEIKDRILIAWDLSRIWDGFYRATEHTLAKERRLETELLVSKSAELARDTTAWFYERFGWMDASPQLLANEQQKLLEGRI